MVTIPATDIITYNYNVSAEQMVRFHLLCYTHMNDIKLSKTEMDALVLLGLIGTVPLKGFCIELARRIIYLSADSARNALGDLCTKKGLVYKQGKHTKMVMLSPELRVSARPGTVLTVNCIHGPKEN